MSNHLMRAATLVALAVSISSTTATAASAEDGQASVSDEVLIQATPKVVWQAVHDERKYDPGLEYSRSLGSMGNVEKIEQKFIGLPFLGSVVATTQQTEVPYSHIDYKLLSSDKFKKLEGSWTLTPVNGGKATLLRLSSRLDIGIPFAGMFIKNATGKKVKLRVQSVKNLAEATQNRLALNGKADL